MPQLQSQILWQEKQISIDQIDIIARKLATDLGKLDFFCLWLIGDIGAGKTTLSSATLHSLGLSPNIRVTSPTFTYFNEYKVGEKSYAHCDFYRITSQTLPFSDFLSGLDYDGILAEWPENLPSSDQSLHPTHLLEIEKSPDLSYRNYTFSKIHN